MNAPRLDLQPGLHDPVILMVSREAVESQDIMSVLGRLRLLGATREDAWLYREQLSIVYDGYENDPRELVDIEEVRSFAKRLHSAWPYWAFFMNGVLLFLVRFRTFPEPLSMRVPRVRPLATRMAA